MTYYSDRHRARVKARARKRILRKLPRSGAALCLLGLNAWAIVTWPNV